MEKYYCSDCGVELDEGEGSVFTCCELCWDKHSKKTDEAKRSQVEKPVMCRFRIYLRSGVVIEKEAEGFTYQEFYTFGVANDKEEEYPQPEIPVIVFYKNGETILDEFYPLSSIDAIVLLEGTYESRSAVGNRNSKDQKKD